MPKFKVGDRVGLTKLAFDNGFLKVGQKGTVLEESAVPFVQWDDFTDGHDGGNPSVEYSSWGVEEDHLKKIKPTKSTQKPKEPKTMTTKKPGTPHGKPTAKGLRVEKKPTAAKVSKYPAPRVQREIETEYGDMAKKTKAQLIDYLTWTAEQFHNLAADHCIAGTKLDRALVDLKEAKKRIKELETLNAAATRLADDQRTEINRLQGARK